MLGAYNRQGLAEESGKSSKDILDDTCIGGHHMSLEHRLRTLREKTARIEVLKLEIEGLQEEIRLSTGNEEIEYLYEQIRAKQGELKRLEDETLPIEKALKGITDKERLVITEFYIKGNTWYVVGVKHQQVFGNYIGRDACRKIRDEALRKITRILGE